MRGRSGVGNWIVIVAGLSVLLFGAAILARALLPLRAILRLEPEAGCTPSLTSSRFPDNAASDVGRWKLVRIYPERRDEVRAAAVSGRIYVGTGLTDRDGRLVATAELFEFDPARRRYRSVPPVPVGVDHTAFVGYEDALYVFGGYVNDKPSSAVWRFSPRTGRWDRLASMSVPRGAPAAAAVKDRIYVVGGTRRERGTEGALPTLEIYDVGAGTWTRGPDMPTPRHHHAAAAMNGRVVVAGGRGNDDLSSDAVEQFDPARARWTKLPSLPLGAGGLAIVATPQRIIAVGGGDDEEQWVTPATWGLDPGDAKWQRLADLNVPRHGHAAAAVGSDVFVFGGAPCPGYGRTDAVEYLQEPSAENTG